MLWRFLRKLKVVLLGEAHTDRNCPPWPGTIVTICMSCLQVVPVRNTELIILHQPEEFGKGQKETPHVLPPPRILLSGIHLGWTRCAPPERTLGQKDWLKTNPITIKPEAASDVAELFSWVPLPYCSPPRCQRFPNKISCCVGTCVSLDNSFPSVRQEPSFRPWKGSPFLQHIY